MRKADRDGSRAGLIDPGSPSAEPFRMLRLALELRKEALSGNVVLFTSAEPGVGKSTLAANYALVSSLTQRTTVLLDCDTKRPTQHQFFGIPRTPGIVELLVSNSNVRHFGHRAATFGHLLVVPAGRALPPGAELASSQRMADLVRQASSDYGLVVIDSPPLLATSDASALTSIEGVDVILVTTPASQRRHLAKALRKLELIGANVAGVVVNREGRLSNYGY